MNQENSIKLNELAEKANFIMAGWYIMGEDTPLRALLDAPITTTIYCRQRDNYPFKREVWPSIEVLAYTNPEDYSSAKLYLIKGENIELAVNGSTIDLSELKPIRDGEDVAKLLRDYAEQRAAIK